MTIRTREQIARVADILKEGRWFLCRLIAEQMGIPKTIVQRTLHEDLQKQKLCTQFVPHALTAKQKEQCLNHAYGLIEMIKCDPNFLGSIITIVTRAGVLHTIWKQSAEVPNGMVQTHRLQKILISKINGKDDADFVV